MERLAADESEGEAEDAAEDGEDPEHPAPGHVLHEEATAHGSDDGTEQWAHGVDGHGASALLRWEHVCDCTGSERQGRSTGTSSEESEGDQHAHGVGEGAGDVEDDEEDVAGVVDGHASVHF